MLPSVHSAPMSLCPVPVCVSSLWSQHLGQGRYHFAQRHREGSIETGEWTSQWTAALGLLSHSDSPASGGTVFILGDGCAIRVGPLSRLRPCADTVEASVRSHPEGHSLERALLLGTFGLRSLSCFWSKTETGSDGQSVILVLFCCDWPFWWVFQGLGLQNTTELIVDPSYQSV